MSTTDDIDVEGIVTRAIVGALRALVDGWEATPNGQDPIPRSFVRQVADRFEAGAA